MLKYFFCFLIGTLFLGCKKNDQSKSLKSVSVIPAPKQIFDSEGSFVMDNTTEIHIEEAIFNNAANQIVNQFTKTTGIRNMIRFGSAYKGINFVNKYKINPGGYILSITPQKVDIFANDEMGAQNAVQTLLQLYHPNIFKENNSENQWFIPCGKIIDYPSQSLRQVKLSNDMEVYNKEMLIEYFNLLGRYKINVVTMNFIDEKGWKFFFKGLPFRLERDRYYTEDDCLALKLDLKGKPIQLIPTIDVGYYVQKMVRKGNDKDLMLLQNEIYHFQKITDTLVVTNSFIPASNQFTSKEITLTNTIVEKIKKNVLLFKKATFLDKLPNVQQVQLGVDEEIWAKKIAQKLW